MEAAAYQEMAAIEDRHWWFVGRRRVIDSLLSKLPLPKDARVLEVGCGSGGNLEMLARYGRLSAGEYNADARGHATARGIASRVADCRLPDQFPFGDETFDLIVMFDVLEHVEDDAATLAAVHRHLAKDGWFVMTVPAFPFLWSEHDVYNHHFRRYTKAQLNRLLDGAGLKPGYQSYFNFWLFPVVAVIRTLKTVLRIGSKVSDLTMPVGPLNRLLAGLFASERFAMGRISLPFGVSFITSAQPIAAASLRRSGV